MTTSWLKNYGDGTQGRHELMADDSDGDSNRYAGGLDKGCEIGDTRGMEVYGGKRAGVLIGQDGVTVFDTQGIEHYRVPTTVLHCAVCGKQIPAMVGKCDCPGAKASDERMRQAYLRWERMHCTECGHRVWEGAIFCRECRPYGFWHWLRYFSPLSWRRIRAEKAVSVEDKRESGQVDARESEDKDSREQRNGE